MNTAENTTNKKHNKIRRALLSLALLLFLLYWVACYFLVSLALVPSFMEKTEVFNTVTEVSIEALVQTDDIKNNRAALWDATNEWLANANLEEVTVTTQDGYRLKGVIFSPTDGSGDAPSMMGGSGSAPSTMNGSGDAPSMMDSSGDAPSTMGSSGDAPSMNSESASHRWALLLHGYTGWKEELYPIACQYAKRGYSVLVPDMRCSGESEGDFIGMGWTDRIDNLLWLNEILARDPEARIALHGQSMGASCALMMAGEELPSQVRAVISDCGYTDAYSMFARQMKSWFGLPSFPLLDSMNLMLQLRGGYDLKDASALNAVQKTSLPLLFLHGKEDDIVPASMAQELYEAASGQKQLLLIEGAGHAQAMEKEPERYFDAVFRFLEKELGR